MKSHSILLLLGVAVMVSSGCSSVTTQFPLPRNPKPIDQGEFEGAWLADDKVLHVQFASNDVANIATLEWESNQFHIVHGEMIVTKGEENNFLSVRFQKEGVWMDAYYFLSYKLTDQGNLILWLPDPDSFEEMVDEKRLQGIIKKGKYSTNIVITNTPAELLKIINDSHNSELFEYKEPIVLKRLTKEN